MHVDRAEDALEYMQMRFAFCSNQCRERFEANPHLYIGFPGQKAPKQERREVIRRRRFRLASPLSDEMAGRVREGIGSMMGIRDVKVDGYHMEISYDLLQATAAQVEAELARQGARARRGLG
jgi:YHS domain-containing protein